MKKLFALLTGLAISSPALTEDDGSYFDFKKMAIERVIAKVGNSRVLAVSLPACTADGDCSAFSQKILFNCASSEVYALGYAPPDAIAQPRLSNFFESADYFKPGVSKLKTTCTQKPEFERIYIWVSQNSSLEGYFLISDTLKKNKNIVTGWIETKQFEKVLSSFFADTKPEDIKDWMYTFEPKPKSPSTKVHWKFNCENGTNSTLAEISYKANGEVLTSNTYPGNNFQVVVPGSIGEGVMNNLCAMY